ARAVLDGPIGQEMLQKFPPKGIQALAWGENGFRHMTNSKHPVNTPDDLKGLKMRTMENPVHIQAYKAFGIIPTPMAFTEVFTALQQGTVDGQENPLSVITAAKFDQVQKNLTLTGHVYSPALILMSKAQWDKLSAADKQAFMEAAKEAVKANRARIDEDERKAVADLRAKGIKALAWGENGFRHMTNNKHPVNAPDDLKGLKMRTMENPIHIEAYKQFGILPTPMAFTEVFTALQQGTVDGQENPLSVITAAKLDQVQKNLTLTGHVYSPAIILMNKAQWDKLSAADKQAFLDAAKEAVKANRARIDEDERKAVADLRAKGMAVVEKVDKAKFQAALAPVYVDFGKKFGQDNIDRIKNYK
ncbi:MAG TPA: DctP family TRAP transporter solute-binding subunit, partial [Casimicrobiaceae bacterium]|nr:DctP family TRAP transporter solute-binding subunit [Casimicrobiaceae bacterium]